MNNQQTEEKKKAKDLQMEVKELEHLALGGGPHVDGEMIPLDAQIAADVANEYYAVLEGKYEETIPKTLSEVYEVHRRISAVKNIVAHKDKAFREMARRYLAWRRKQLEPFEQAIAWLERKVLVWAEKNKAAIESSGKRSISTPLGRVGFRKEPDKWIYEDEDLATRWLQKHRPHLVETKTRIKKWEVKKEFKDAKVVPPGIQREKGEDTSYVQTR